MKFHNAMLMALGLAMTSLVGYANAQIYSSTSNKKMATFLGAGYNSTYDTSTDNSGNRYVVGYGPDGGRLTKISKKGFALFSVSAGSVEGYVPIAVAADNAGHVYAVSPTSNSYVIQQFDATTGNLNWTTAEFEYQGYPYDIAVQPDGSPVVLSTSLLFDANYHGLMVKWQSDGTFWSQGYYVPGETSQLWNLAVDASGGVYAAGYVYTGAGDLAGQMLYANSSFTGSVYPSYDSGTTDEYFTEVAVDPATQVAVAVGGTYTTGFNDANPLVGSLMIDNSSGSPVASTSNYPFNVYPAGSIGQGIAIDENGMMYMAVTSDRVGTPRASVYAFFASPSPHVLYYAWDQTVPATDAGTYDHAFDIVADPYGCVLGVVSDLTVGIGASAHQGIQTFSFSPTGAPIDRRMFGSSSIPATLATNGYWDYMRTCMSAAGGYLSIYGNGNDGAGYLYTAQLKNGANDSFRVDEDSPLNVGLAKSVLNNDGNQFKFDPLSCALINSSVSAGIQSLTLNPDGTFNATFVANFNGVAKFRYRVKQNGVVIDDNLVTINVKPINDAPTAVADSFNVAMNSAVQNLNVLANDYDLDVEEIWVKEKTNNPNATIGMTPDKKFITFKPKPGFSGDVNFTVTIRDGVGATSTANVVVHVS